MNIRLWAHRMKVERTRRRLQLEYVKNGGETWSPPVPPPSINFNQVLSGSLERYRETYLEQSRDRELPFARSLANLGPSSVTLDFGCGLGRLASAFAAAGAGIGTYLGWEPEPAARHWLQGAYESLEAFEFGGETLSPELNYITQQNSREAMGVRTGAVPNELGWESFLKGRGVDLVWSHSVFTHMWPEDAVANLSLLKNSCNPGAVMIHTWLILDDFALAGLSQGMTDRSLPFEIGGIRTLSRNNPLDCTAYPIALLKDVYSQAGIEVTDLLYGSWAGRGNGVTYQDIVVSRIP